jgi:hypothetical protein
MDARKRALGSTRATAGSRWQRANAAIRDRSSVCFVIGGRETRTLSLGSPFGLIPDLWRRNRERSGADRPRAGGRFRQSNFPRNSRAPSTGGPPTMAYRAPRRSATSSSRRWQSLGRPQRAAEPRPPNWLPRRSTKSVLHRHPMRSGKGENAGSSKAPGNSEIFAATVRSRNG